MADYNSAVMDASGSIPGFSLPLGSVRGIRIRISVLLPAAILAVMWRLGSLPYGLLAGGILSGCVLLHQIAQVFVARATGHGPSTVVLWPLGGLTNHGRNAEFPVQAQIQLAGPIVCFITAAVCAFQLRQLGSPLDPLMLLQGFRLLPEAPFGVTILRMTCFASSLIVAASLLPVIPFDGGRLLRGFLAERRDVYEVSDIMLRLGLVFGFLGLMTGFVFDQSTLAALSGFILILHLNELQIRVIHRSEAPIDSDSDSETAWQGPFDDDSAFHESYGDGSDFDTDELIARSGMMARHQARRESERRRREAELRRQQEEQLDAILDIIHRKGEAALNPAERRLLKKASRRLRTRRKSEQRRSESGS